MEPSRKIEAVTFDAGGTLIEPWPSVGGVYADVAREFGIPCDPNHLTAQFFDAWTGRTGFRYTRDEWAEVVRHSFSGVIEVSANLFNAIYERFSEARSWLIYDDVIPTLQELEKMALKIAVISNWDERLGPLLQALGLATYFDEVIISSNIGAHKPDQRIFEAAARQLDVRPQSILHIGDSWKEDVQGALAAGAMAARIRRSGVERKEDLTRLTEAVSLLRGLDPV